MLFIKEFYSLDEERQKKLQNFVTFFKNFYPNLVKQFKNVKL